MTFRREDELAAPVSRFLRNRGFGAQGEEIQFYDRRMDLYAVCGRSGVTASVELKLANWPRAIEQALLYQLCSDLVYVAVPRSVVSRVDREVLRRHGIGLIAVEAHRCREIVSASPSTVVRHYYREELVSLMRKAER